MNAHENARRRVWFAIRELSAQGRELQGYRLIMHPHYHERIWGDMPADVRLATKPGTLWGLPVELTTKVSKHAIELVHTVIA